MKLILTDNDGVVLDSTEVTQEDWNKAQASPMLAHLILTELQTGYPTYPTMGTIKKDI